MMDGFNLDNPLVCEGIIGDGCGGGRLFFINEDKLLAHDPITQEDTLLLENIKNPKQISKKSCIVTIKCKDEEIFFDLSKMRKIN